MEYKPFKHCPESLPPLPVSKPVNKVASHLGGNAVQLKEAVVIAQRPGGTQLEGEADALILFLLNGQAGHEGGDV